MFAAHLMHGFVQLFTTAIHAPRQEYYQHDGWLSGGTEDCHDFACCAALVFMVWLLRCGCARAGGGGGG